MNILIGYFLNPLYSIPKEYVGIYCTGLIRLTFLMSIVVWSMGESFSLLTYALVFFFNDFIFYKDIADIVAEEDEKEL